MNVLEVVKKLRILADPARNDNAYQRDAAKRKAVELMAKHGITEADLRGTNKQFEEWIEDTDSIINIILDANDRFFERVRGIGQKELGKMSEQIRKGWWMRQAMFRNIAKYRRDSKRRELR